MTYSNSIKLNGKKYNTSWINWSDLEKGGKIEFELTSRPQPKWAVDAELPSFNSY